MSKIAAIWLATISIAFSACGNGDLLNVCTDIGCAGGLTVAFDRDPAIDLTVEAMSGPARVVVDCGPSHRDCRSGVTFEGFTPNSVSLRFTSGAGSFSESFTPEYQNSRPNGPNCGPDFCLSATVMVQLPEGW